MAKKKTEPTSSKVRSGPRAPDGKAPLQVIVAESTIEEAKIEVIKLKTSVSRVVEELLQGWLDGTYKLKD